MRTKHGRFSYVYILQSTSYPEQSYIGLSDDLKSRLAAHNAGGCPHTNKYRPWQIETAISFRSREKAAAFERYLKSGSGRAFAKRHFQYTPSASHNRKQCPHPLAHQHCGKYRQKSANKHVFRKSLLLQLFHACQPFGRNDETDGGQIVR